MPLFSRSVSDLLAGKVRRSTLDQGHKLIIVDFLLDTIEELNPEFDRRRFLQKAGMLETPTETQFTDDKGSSR